MSVFAIGVDLVEIERIEKMIERYSDKFIKRVFTEKEIRYCSKKANRGSFAARFATKEAVFKATGLGQTEGITWQDVEVLNDRKGKPQVFLHGKIAEIFKGRTIYISISHSRSNAIAMVVVE